MSWSAISPASRVAIIFAIIGAVFSVQFTSQSSLNEEITSCFSLDFVGFVAGPVAFYFAVIGGLVAAVDANARALNLVLCGIAFASGVYVFLRAIGVFNAFC